MANAQQRAQRMSGDLDLGKVYDSVEEAEGAAAEEAEAAGVAPMAVMKSAPEGYGSGAKDTPKTG